MRRRLYAFSAVILLGLFGASYIAIEEYNKPSYQVKDYSVTLTQMGSAKFSQLYHFMMRKNEDGVIDPKEVLNARRAIGNMSTHKNAANELYWRELGPNYVGGRTRALIQDNQAGNESIFYAGSVAGGVFVSYNGGEQWYGYSSDLTTLNIGDLAQTSNGTLFVGTGPGHDNGHGNGPSSSNGFMGDGLFRRVMDGNGGHTFERLIGPSALQANTDWALINRIKTHPTDPNKIYVGTSRGLMVSANAQATASEINFFNAIEITQGLPFTGAIDDIAVSNDGSTVYVVSGANFFKLSDLGGTNISLTTSSSFSVGIGSPDRISLGLAPSNNNVIYAAIASNNGTAPCTFGIFQSKDAGETWANIGPGGGSFDPYVSLGCQGDWDNDCAVSPTNPGRLIVGGVSLYEFEESTTAPGTGSWNRIALTTGGGLVDTNYVHADKHRILWVDSATIYIASDGGIGKSLDGGKTWGQNNNGYNVTQFYSIDAAFGVYTELDSFIFSNGEQVVGGTQDNGTQLIGVNFRPDVATEILGGDGFDVAFSNLANLAFASVYYGAIQRINTSGNGGSFFDAELQALCVDVPAGVQGCGPFYTRFAYWESADVPFTYDSIKIFKGDTNKVLAGDTIYYESNIGDVPLFWPAPKNMNKGDSAIMPDFAQSKFAFATGPQGVSNRIYMTKDAANVNEVNPEWDLIADASSGISGNVFKMAFSGDGNQLFVATQGGNVYRIDNLNYGYDSLSLDIRSPQSVVTTTFIATTQNGASISGLSVDPNDPENVVISAPGYGGTNKIWRIQNASTRTTSSTATPIQGDFPTGVPVYCCLIADHNPNTVIIGTEFGIYATDNAMDAAPTWSQAQGMPIVATYDLVQQTNKYLHGDREPRIENYHYRKVYAGTHGRGFWATDNLVGLDDDHGPKKKIPQKDQQIQFKIYPNPLSSNGFMEIFLPKNERVTVDIFDLNGKLISTIRSGELVEGKNKLNFDVSSMPNGTYIAALKSSDEMKVSKFVVMK